ncbi:COX15/CtaA family protein [Termitidicoccus mucosus]|uniref:COX15/CtaA family protein n=1 Tax=Termitidicoccus mucosus TaxID=1184151 RepID=UPI000838C6E4
MSTPTASPAAARARPPRGRRAFRHRPALAWFAALGSAWVFVLVTLGAFTTSIGAGMVFADWPLSNGSLNPEGWLADAAMFAEHSHRLSGATMGLFTIVLAAWLWLVEPRRWLRALGGGALALVVAQGVIGGQRVTLDALHLPGVAMSVGQMLRIPHGILAQVFVCVLFAIAAALSRPWMARDAGFGSAADARSSGPGAKGNTGGQTVPPNLRRLALAALALVFVQLVVAAAMRHNHAGLAIPTFPLAADGGLLPAQWDFRVALAFAHRALAAALVIVLPWLAIATWREPAAPRGLKRLAAAMLVLLATQIALGAFTVWTMRGAYVATAHVINGAAVLATVFLLAWWLHRERIEHRAGWRPEPGAKTPAPTGETAATARLASSP